MKNIYLSIIILLVISTGCYDNIDTTPPTTVVIETPAVFVKTQLSGSVIDDDGQLISDYYLDINGDITDIASDYFFLEIEDAKKKGQTIKVIKDGNPIALKTTLLIENDINHIQIERHDEITTAQKSNATAVLQLSKDITLDLTNTSYTNQTNDQVLIDYAIIGTEIGLSPIAFDEVGGVLALDARGGFYLSLRNEDGSDLILDDESRISILFDSKPENANSIYHYEEQLQVWLKIDDISEGDITLLPGQGYYAFGTSTGGVFVEGMIAKDNSSVAYQQMEWKNEGLHNGICATESGRWIGVLPTNSNTNLDLVNPCGETTQQETITVDSDDQTSTLINISDNSNYQYLNHTIVDCEGNEISDGAINIESGSSTQHLVFEESNQNRWISVCDQFEIAAYNESESASGSSIPWSASIPSQELVLSDCVTLERGYGFVQIRSDEKVFPAFDVSQTNEQTTLSATDGSMTIKFRGTTPGAYDDKQVNISINDNMFGDNGYFISCQNTMEGCGVMSFNVQASVDGDRWIITFDGTLWMQTITPAVAGNFPVEGQILVEL